MEKTYWQKQTVDAPLFPDLIWSRPETKRARGKLLIAGGQAQGFAAPAEAYGTAEVAGIGTARVLLPDRLQKTVARIFPAAEFAHSTPSGSYGQAALGEILALAEWADGVLLAGDFGKNSETAILLEKFLDKYRGQVTLTGDSLDYFLNNPTQLLGREKTTAVPSFAQLQKIATAARFATPFTSTMDFLHLVDALHEFTQSHKTNIVLAHEQTIFVAANGLVSTTKAPAKSLQLAARTSVWWLQTPAKTFESLSCAAFELAP